LIESESVAEKRRVWRLDAGGSYARARRGGGLGEGGGRREGT
jgi:hypothetical protein